MALFEDTITDTGTGRIVNATFGDYLVSVNADVPDLDVAFVCEPDRGNPIGTKGSGGGRSGRHRRSGGQRGLPRHRETSPLPADHDRQLIVSPGHQDPRSATALLTGATSGIGRVTARRPSDQGSLVGRTPALFVPGPQGIDPGGKGLGHGRTSPDAVTGQPTNFQLRILKEYRPCVPPN
jgi:hypothetical protein